MMYKQNFEAAKSYQQLGWSVIPARGKVPAVRWKFYQDMLPDDDDIDEWFGPAGKFRNDNIGIIAGKISRNIVLDFDHTDAVKAFKERNNGQRIQCPQTLTAKGLHAYFNYPAELTFLFDENRIKNFVGKLEKIDRRFKHLDLRADGGFVVTPPSMHESGKRYRWAVGPQECPPADLPDWFVKLLIDDGNDTRKSKNDASTHESGRFGNDYANLWKGVSQGQRDTTCTKLAGHYFAKGLSLQEVTEMLLSWNERNDPPQPESEIIKSVLSIYEKEQQKRLAQMNAIPDAIRFTDGFNAKRFITEYGENIRFVPDWDKWLIWDKTRYLIDRKLWAIRLAKETVKNMLAEAANEQDDSERKALVKHAIKSDSHTKYKAMVELAKSEPTIPIQSDELDSEPMLLNVANGTIDLRTGKIRPHDKSNLITKLAPVEHDPDAVCPFWLHSLKIYMRGNDELIQFLQKAVGYATSQKIFGGKLGEKGLERRRGTGNANYWFGVGIMENSYRSVEESYPSENAEEASNGGDSDIPTLL